MIPLYDQNPPNNRPFITRWLIYLNVAVFLWQWWTGPRARRRDEALAASMR